MSMFDLSELLYYIPAILLALTFHEFAHGIVAYRLGDPTPKYQGRLTLNPLAHLDPLGTLLFVIAHFGWAKPVQINPMNFQGDRVRGMMKVSLAGPFVNFVLAYLSAVIFSFIYRGILPYNDYLVGFLQACIFINLVLAAFNLIPVPPLDGSKILAGLLPRKYTYWIFQLEQYGPLLLLLLIVSGATSTILNPLINGLYKIILLTTGLPY